MDIKNTGFDIIVLAGQSNAEGNGKSLDKHPLIIDNAYELDDVNEFGIKLKEDGSYGGLELKMPVETIVKQLQERKSGDAYYSDLSLYFAKKYIESGCLKNGRKLLVVKAAFGGTGFAFHQQGVGNILYERLIQMTKSALSLNEQSKIVAFLWHQGEHDAFENAQFSDQERYDFYYNNLKEQFSSFRNEFKQFNFPYITGGFCDEWKKDYLNQCIAVENATKDVCKDLGNSSFVDLSNLNSNHQDIGTDDPIHFSKKSLKIIGEKYFEKFKLLIECEKVY